MSRKSSPKKAAQEVAQLTVTYNADEVRAEATEIVIMELRRLVADSTFEELPSTIQELLEEELAEAVMRLSPSDYDKMVRKWLGLSR